jgi:hypothetical protein
MRAESMVKRTAGGLRHRLTIALGWIQITNRGAKALRVILWMMQWPIRGMFGAMHNELNEVNSNIVEQSSGLKARQINKEVMDRDILNLVGTPEMKKQNVPYGMNPSGIGNTRPAPDANWDAPSPAPTDPNQIEFNFDNSATAQDILNKLDDVEKKVARFSKDLQHITELLEKKK